MIGFFIDGDFREFNDPATNYLRFDGLKVCEAITLARFALQQGFQVVLVSEEAGDVDGTEESCPQL